ncbi:hypothetical protein CBA19CS22_37940 [Caballeronia novacaledonica]|uniref:Uncharacterized protein n=1 Tax=Caballeronia novacaledonica TaxID=1544861 RepID=A0ACB5R5G7_9BURK|nr:hypothetical protein CBA19CS22_37940 [Caballeronia novacaledonica]
MSSRERFNEWYAKEYDGHDSGLLMTYGAAWAAWQAAERQALERAAQACKKEAEDSKRHRLHEYAAGANICASNIRELMEPK